MPTGREREIAEGGIIPTPAEMDMLREHLANQPTIETGEYTVYTSIEGALRYQNAIDQYTMDVIRNIGEAEPEGVDNDEVEPVITDRYFFEAAIRDAAVTYEQAAFREPEYEQEKPSELWTEEDFERRGLTP